MKTLHAITIEGWGVITSVSVMKSNNVQNGQAGVN